MQHHRSTPLVLGINIFCAQTLRHGKINLYCAALPLPTNGVLEGILNLGSIKCPFTLSNLIVTTAVLDALHQSLLVLVPNLISTNALFRTGVNLLHVFLESILDISLL